MRRIRQLGALLWVAAVGACASAPPRPPADGLARLERAHEANPNSVPTTRALGVAYYGAKRYDDARHVLDDASKRDPNDGVVALYAGMSAEQTGDLAAARGYYTNYVAHGKTASVRRQLRAKLADLDRRELVASTRGLIQREAELSATPGQPNTIAVFPLRFTGSDSTLKPLERGLADLLITDLGRVQRLRIVERDRIQVLLDELALAQSGRVDDATAARGGRIVQAGRFVQGSINQSAQGRLSLSASVIAPTGAIVSNTTQRDNALDQLFATEKQLTFDILEKLQITPTAAETRLITQQPTRSVAAFLAFSQGLQAEDQGDYTNASRLFQEATRIDPSFAPAAQHQAAAQANLLAPTVTPTTVEAGLQGSAEGNVVVAAGRGDIGIDTRLTTLNQTSADLIPSATAAAAGAGGATNSTPTPVRDPTSTQGTDHVGQATGTIRIVIDQPGN